MVAIFRLFAFTRRGTFCSARLISANRARLGSLARFMHAIALYSERYVSERKCIFARSSKFKRRFRSIALDWVTAIFVTRKLKLTFLRAKIIRGSRFFSIPLSRTVREYCLNFKRSLPQLVCGFPPHPRMRLSKLATRIPRAIFFRIPRHWRYEVRILNGLCEATWRQISRRQI